MIALEEKVNMEKLKKIASNFEDIVMKNNLLKFFKDQDNNPMDLKKAKTSFMKFYRQHTIEGGKIQYKPCSYLKDGRIYGTNSLQTLPRPLRHTLCEGIYVDIDIVNCHPNLIEDLCSKLNIETPTLAMYNQEREKCLEHVMEEQKIDREEAKQLMISICYGCGDSPDWCDFLVDFYNDLRKIHSKVRIHFPEQYKVAVDQGKTNPSASGLSYKCQQVEMKLLMKMYKFCKKNNKVVGVLCHDGLMCEIGDTNYDVFVKSLEEEVGMKLSTKPFTNAIDLSQYEVKEIDLECIEAEYEDQNDMIIDKKKDMPDKMKMFRNENYLAKKREWEETHFKLLNPIRYCTIDSKGELMEKTPREYQDTYVNEYIRNGHILYPFLYYWMSDPKIKTYEKMEFHPEPNCPPNIYNTYTGLYCDQLDESNYDAERGEKGLSYWLEVLAIVCNYDVKTIEFVKKLYALGIQKPWKRWHLMVFFTGENGTGKTALQKYHKAMIGDKHATIIENIKQITGDFNEIIVNQLYICWDDPKDDDGQTTKGLNSFLTASRTPLNMKHQNIKRGVKNYINMMGTLNKQKVFRFDGGDRRYMIIKSCNKKSFYYSENADWWKMVCTEYLNDEQICPHTMICVRNYLRSIDVSNFNPQGEKITTTEFTNEKEKQMDSVLAFLREQIEEGYFNLDPNNRKKEKELWEEYGKWYKESFPDTKYMRKKQSFNQEVRSYSISYKEYSEQNEKFTPDKFIIQTRDGNHNYYRFSSSALTQYLYHYQYLVPSDKQPEIKIEEEQKEEKEEKEKEDQEKKMMEEIDKYDIKVYPRTSPLLQYWDKTYQEVFNLDQTNSDHPNPFKKYVSAKLLLMNNFS